MKIPIGILNDPHARSRIILRWTGITAASAGGVIGIIWGSRYSSSSHEFQNQSAKNPNNLSQNSSVSWNSARLNKNKDLAMLLTGCGIAALGAIGIGWAFTF
jgi:hypothetical protein